MSVMRTRPKLSSREITRIKKCYPLIRAHFQRNGDVLPRTAVETVYSPEAIAQAIADGIIKEATAIRRSPGNVHPNEKIMIVHLPCWNGSKPDWLDSYEPKGVLRHGE